MVAIFGFLALFTMIVIFMGVISPKRLKLESNLKNRGKILIGGAITIMVLASLTPVQHQKTRDELVEERVKLDLEIEKQNIALKKEQSQERAREEKEKELKQKRAKLEKILKKEKYIGWSPLGGEWDGSILTFGLISDGSNADGYGQRLCEVAKKNGFDREVLSYVVLINGGKMAKYGKYEKVGEGFCK